MIQKLLIFNYNHLHFLEQIHEYDFSFALDNRIPHIVEFTRPNKGNLGVITLQFIFDGSEFEGN